MAKNSSINKVKEIVQRISKLNKNITVSELAISLNKKSNSFFYYSRNDVTNEVEEYACSTNSIRSKIRFCVKIGLIKNEENCNLTQYGINAVDENRFSLSLQTSILSYFEGIDKPWDQTESLIKELRFPTADNIVENLEINKKQRSVFKLCLSLLTECTPNMVNKQIMQVYLN